MITTCPQCGGLRAAPGERYAGKPCECLLASSGLLACRQFEEEDREAIERVTMLLVEYAWSNDRMSDNAKKLKAAMLRVWEHWQARQANDKVSDAPDSAAPNRRQSNE